MKAKHSTSLRSKPRLSIVIPCFNEEEVIENTAKKLLQVVDNLIAQNKIKSSSNLLMVDDGSSDKTWDKITNIVSNHKRKCKAIKLSRNFGQQKALIAGYQESLDADCILSIDADLQDDVSAIPKMLDKYKQGAEIVYGVRNDRGTDGIVKKVTAELFYKIIKRKNREIVFNHADFRLMGNRSVRYLLEHEERNLFLRGLIPSLGFTSDIVEYKRQKRNRGKTKYSILKMISFAWEGITSLNTTPLRIVTLSGAVIVLVTFLVAVWVFIEIIMHHTVPGWGSLILSLYFLGGIQILFLGIVGEYIGKIYFETKKRPRVNIEEKLE